MKRKTTWLLIALTLIINLLLSACGKPEDIWGNQGEKEPKVLTVNDVSAQDSSTIYRDDDEDSLVTMYLTVSQGNEADNTNHTWTDVNDHSVYYYDERGIDRYRVEGI